MTDDSQGNPCLFTILGMFIIVGGSLGGFLLFFQQDIFDLGVGQILLYMLGIPMVSMLLGAGVILYGNRHRIRAANAMTRSLWSGTPLAAPAPARERSYVHQPPRFCPECGAGLTAERIEWVGPLTVKCPYCNATVATEKHEV